MAAPADLPQLDLGEVDRLQAEVIALVEELERTADSERQQALVQEISRLSEKLTVVCEDLEARARATARDLRGEIEIVLTADQREQVRSETGVDMESVVVEDNGGGLVAAMPHMTREEVFELALDAAHRQARVAQARDAARVELARITGELRENASSVVRKEIDRLLEDPEFRRAFEPPPSKKK